MKQTLYLILYVAILVIVGCTGKDSQSLSDIPEATVRTHADSLALAARFTGDFEHFLAVTDSLADAGGLSPIRANGFRGVAYFQLGQVDKCIEHFRNAIADENPPAADFWEYIHAGTNLVIILNSQRNYDSAMRITLRLINLLKQVESPSRDIELQTLYLCLGDTKMMLERRDEAVESYNEAYQWVLRTRNNATCRPLAASIETVENIVASHINHQMEAGIWVDRMDSLLTVYEAQPKAVDKEVKTFRALVLLHRAQVCQMQGKEIEAARYYEQYKSTEYGSSIEGRINGCDYLVKARRYVEAADNYTQLDRFIKEWGYEYDLETISNNLLPKLRSNYHAGRRDSALHVAMQIAEVYGSALVQQKQRDAAELATIYDIQGKERQIVEQRAGKRLFTAISIAVAILALLILAFAIYVFRQWRTTKEKNRILAQQIAEALAVKEQLKEQRQAGTPAEVSIDLSALSDADLFCHLSNVIERDKLFLDPACDRQMLTDHFQLSKERIGAAFSHGSDHDNLTAYIRTLRLDFAAQMLTDNPDYDVSQVAGASGFSSPGYFSTCFRKHFGLSPSDFRDARRLQPDNPDENGNF